MILVRKLVLLCLKLNINFRSTHIEGRSNIYSDKLSRLQIKEFLKMAPWADKDPYRIPAFAQPNACDMTMR